MVNWLSVGGHLAEVCRDLACDAVWTSADQRHLLEECRTGPYSPIANGGPLSRALVALEPVARQDALYNRPRETPIRVVSSHCRQNNTSPLACREFRREACSGIGLSCYVEVA